MTIIFEIQNKGYSPFSNGFAEVIVGAPIGSTRNFALALILGVKKFHIFGKSENVIEFSKKVKVDIITFLGSPL